jgi:hypothetical protein
MSIPPPTPPAKGPNTDFGGEGESVLPRLAIYVRTSPVPRLKLWQRGLALGVSAGCFALLVIASRLRPDGRGVGTHEQLGLAPCSSVALFGVPCPTCGFTTSFAYFVRGNWLMSLYNQPAGFLTAVLALAVAWAGLYVAVTGTRPYRLVTGRVRPSHVMVGAMVLVLAWAWKIVLHVLG